MESYILASLLSGTTIAEVIAAMNMVINLWKMYKEIKEELEDEEVLLRISGLIFTKGVDF